MQIERHQGVAFLLHLADQVLDVVFLEQQLLGAYRIGVDVRGGCFERVDLAPQQKQFTVANQHIAVGQLHLAFPQSLDLPAIQHHARFVAFLEEIVVGRLLVIGNAGLGIGFFGHRV